MLTPGNRAAGLGVEPMMSVLQLHPPNATLIAYLTDLLESAKDGKVDGVIVIVQTDGEPAVSFVGDLDAGAAALGIRVVDRELDRRLHTSTAPAQT